MVLNDIIATKFLVVQDSLEQHYKAIGTYCRRGGSWDTELLDLLERAILLPLSTDRGEHASYAFALEFLTQPDLELFENNVASFAERVHAEKLSAAILKAYSSGQAIAKETEARLWLLAHYIALQKGQHDAAHAPSYLKALYTQLSSLQLELRARHVGQGTAGAKQPEGSSNHLPPFIEQAIETLVERDEISNLLERFKT